MHDALATACLVLGIALLLGSPVFLLQVRAARRRGAAPARPVPRPGRPWFRRPASPTLPAGPEAAAPVAVPAPVHAEARIAALEAELAEARAAAAGLRENLDLARRLIAVHERTIATLRPDTAAFVRHDGHVRDAELGRVAAE